MVLYSDAAPCTTKYEFKNVLKKSILCKVEDDLDLDEKISILFLIADNYECAFKEIYDLLQKHKTQNSYILSEFIDRHPNNWENKLLEAICVIQNRQIVRKLGVPFEKMDILYCPRNRSCSRYLKRVVKCLYLLCEELSKDETESLVQYFRSHFPKYEETLKDSEYLELHMLYWLEQKYISIDLDGKVNLENLLRYLKRYDDLEIIYNDLKKHENHQNVLDTQNANSLNTFQLQTFSKCEGTQIPLNVDDIKKIKKGLCIIISQMFFIGEKFETRFGTVADCRKLSETFSGFGFKVEIFKNLKKDEMLKKLENIPKEFGTDYDCIFLCILSHGCKGCIISSDVEKITIEQIEYKICCTELKDVNKIVIVQACQGQAKGQINDNLAVDGPDHDIVPDILAYQNFCVFMSTLQGFVSVRHKAEGSWFIQEFCNVLQNGGSKMTFLCAVRKIIQSVKQKRGNLNGQSSISQLPELRSYRLLTDLLLPEYRTQRVN
ncbi:caspase-8 isoform X1 [Hylaeus volcanicus]|uniref:caspase-8 isoform X1 n=1 Tax=Hylaeus volcanicus TaxID=313075 RepID=UPI0023B77E05|nr:caspase-8 isoform X1 [Hylaeus volcanicus]XP_053978684.1 caspase-8 isoform X1 [Hylaeus volcanicus]